MTSFLELIFPFAFWFFLLKGSLRKLCRGESEAVKEPKKTGYEHEEQYKENKQLHYSQAEQI